MVSIVQACSRIASHNRRNRLLFFILTCCMIGSSLSSGKKEKIKSEKMPTFQPQNFKSSSFYKTCRDCWHIAFKYAHDEEQTKTTKLISGQKREGIRVGLANKECFARNSVLYNNAVVTLQEMIMKVFKYQTTHFESMNPSEREIVERNFRRLEREKNCYEKLKEFFRGFKQVDIDDPYYTFMEGGDPELISGEDGAEKYC